MDATEFKVPKSRKSEEIEISRETHDEKQHDQPVHPYNKPSWDATPEEEYSFEVLKNGQIVETFSRLETQSTWFFGRLPNNNDVVLAHPTISRFHAVLQYKGSGGEPPKKDQDDDEEEKEPSAEPGWYIYDLGSTHGTFVNKQRVPPKTYVRLRVGYMLKMGASTRNFILLGPDHDEEEVKAESITAMKEQKRKLIEEMELKREQQQKELEEQLKAKEAEGISWGMAEDAEDEPDLSVNPFAVTTNEELFLDDPKKTLRGYFEREGLELEYKVEDLPNNTFVCRVELPLDDENGRSLRAEATHKGKKKDCVLQCALEACRILDRHGVLRKANQEAALRRKKADSDSDNDDFLDRTGDIEKKRKRKAQSEGTAAVGYDDLVQQEMELQKSIVELEEKILASKSVSQQQKETVVDGDDDLDDFMHRLDSKKPVDKVEIKKYRVEQQALQKELKQVQRLKEIAKPLDLPKISGPSSSSATIVGETNLPLFGKKAKLEVKSTSSRINPPKPVPDNSELTTEEEFDEEADDPLATKSAESEPPPIDKDIPSQPPKITEQPIGEDTLEAQRKKRQRIRMRNKVRDNVDMEETVEEAEEKFTDWLPPVNQSGDGTTSLNDKLGY